MYITLYVKQAASSSTQVHVHVHTKTCVTKMTIYIWYTCTHVNSELESITIELAVPTSTEAANRASRIQAVLACKPSSTE